MNTSKLIISDLHLVDGEAMWDTFGEPQQAALEGLLAAASKGRGGPLGEADEVELIINGDCIDFLGTKPYDTGGVIDAGLALEKLAHVIAAHGPFFQALGTFVKHPGRRITFLTGNHDIELCFAEVRAGMVQAMGLLPGDQRVGFSATRGYRPLPDIYIEHGNAYDFWTCDPGGCWNTPDNARAANPQVVKLPYGSHYMQHVGLPIAKKYPYLALFEPQLSFVRQVALFCLLNPAVLVELIQHVSELVDAGGHNGREVPRMAGSEELHPVALFEQVAMALLAFQQATAARLAGWKEPLGEEAAQQAQMRTMMEIVMIRELLSRTSEGLSMRDAIAELCVREVNMVAEGLATGMQNLLKSDPSLRYAFAGHIHSTRIDTIKEGIAEQQVYMNTGSWLWRLALPEPEEVTPELVAWLLEPNSEHIPLREVPPQCVFALVTATNGGPSSAQLCVWEGGRSGKHRVLAEP